MRFIRSAFSTLNSLPVILTFLASPAVGGQYDIGFWAKLRLLIRFYRNTRRIETLSDFREHLELASAILRVSPSAKGSVVECGCYVGGSTANLSLVCSMTGRKLIVFDSFAGLPEPGEHDRWHHAVHTNHTDVYYKGRFAAAQGIVESNVGRFGDLNVCEFRAGYYEDTMTNIQEDIIMAFLDVDLIESLKPCLKGLWPNLQEGCRLYTHEARNLAFISLYFDSAWWRETLDCDAPGFVGGGTGLPLGIGWNSGSELGYAAKLSHSYTVAPNEDPEVLKRALYKSELDTFTAMNPK